MKDHLPHHPTQLYLIRHGEPAERYHQVFCGSRMDPELSAKGHRQAAGVARWMLETPLDAIYASPMLRVQQTMAPLIAARAIKPVFIPSLREMDFGDWTGYRWDGIKETFGVSAFDWLEIIDGAGIPNGESAHQLVHRVQPALLKVLHDNPHRKVAIFCHGGIIRVMLAMLLDLPLTRMAHFNIEYGSISVVELLPDKKHAVQVELLNYVPDLQGAHS